MKYEKMIDQIIKQVGGTDNISHFTHCSTRLRFTLNSKSKVSLEHLKQIDGVLEALDKAGQIQVVIGNHVGDVFKEANQKYHLSSLEANTNNDEEKSGVVSRVIDTIVGIFSPIIPAVTGAGMLKSVLAILTIFNLVPSDSQTYYIINFISDAIFYFLPVLLAFSSARKFNTEPYLAAGVAGILLHPNWSTLVTAGEPVSFFNIPVTLFSYASTAIPIILIVWFMSHAERFADKVSPQVVKFILKPLITLMITAPVALIVIGPIGSFLGNGIVDILNFFDSKAAFLVPTLMGAFMPLMVSIGIHMSFTPVAAMSLAQNGFDRFSGPGMLASNIAQSGATFAVAIKTKDLKFRQLATSAAVTALFGITEPALYGVTLKLKRPLISVIISGGIAGFYAGITGLYRTAFSSPGLAALPTYVTDDPMNLIHAIITMLIAFIGSFILAMVFGFEDVVAQSTSADEIDESPATTTELNAISPNSEVIPLSDVNDPTFASEAMGKGIGVKVTDNQIYSPVTGTITSIFPTKHAIGITTQDGLEILIHMGIDTVELSGKYFNTYINEGEKIQRGKLIAEMNVTEIEKAGYDTTVMVVVTNSNNLTAKFNYQIGRKDTLNEAMIILE